MILSSAGNGNLSNKLKIFFCVTEFIWLWVLKINDLVKHDEQDNDQRHRAGEVVIIFSLFPLADFPQCQPDRSIINQPLLILLFINVIFYKINKYQESEFKKKLIHWNCRILSVCKSSAVACKAVIFNHSNQIENKYIRWTADFNWS